MPYVDRKNGKVVGFAANPQPNWPKELLAEDHPDFVAYLRSQEDSPADNRKRAYAAESDALVIRAMRLQLAGDPGFEAAKAEALAKVAEIKSANPDKEA